MNDIHRISRSVGVIALIAIALLAGCTENKQASSDESVFDTARSNRPAATAVRGLEAREALEVANRWGPGTDGVTTFVDQTKVSFAFDNGDKVEVPLPQSEMVVAIAPYVNHTHPCEIHYMSGCQGELVGVPVDVVGTDENGSVLIEGTFTTMDNGFIELWLPRDKTINLSLEAQDKNATGVITTRSDSNTCITTFKLSA